MKTAYILPTGNEIKNGVVLDLDSSEIMGQIVKQYPTAAVTRLSPLVDEEDEIASKVKELCASEPDLIVLIGGSGGGHRFSKSLGKDYTHSALERILDEKASREIYGKNGHMWSKLICGHLGRTLVVNVPGPFEEAKAAMKACLSAIENDDDIVSMCEKVAGAVFAQYPSGKASPAAPV